MKKIFRIFCLFAAVLFAASAVLLSCSKGEGNINKEADLDDVPVVNKIPYTITVGSNSGSTKMHLDGSSYKFTALDRIYIENTTTDHEGEYLWGYMNIQPVSGEKGPGYGTATFTGVLNFDDFSHVTNELETKITLISDANKLTRTFTGTSGHCISAPTYPTAANSIAADLSEAVEWFSDSQATSTFGTPNFTLGQGSTFFVFNVYFWGVSSVNAADIPITVTVKFNSTEANWRTGTVNTTKPATYPIISFVAACPAMQVGVAEPATPAEVILTWASGTKTTTLNFGPVNALANKYYTANRLITEFDVVVPGDQGNGGNQ